MKRVDAARIVRGKHDEDVIIHTGNGVYVGEIEMNDGAIHIMEAISFALMLKGYDVRKLADGCEDVVKQYEEREKERKRDGEGKTSEEKQSEEWSWCEGCKWEDDQSCCCHGGKGYEAKEEKEEKR